MVTARGDSTQDDATHEDRPTVDDSTRAEDRLAGHTIAVTGTLATMSHEEFARLVRDLGGTFVHIPTRQTDMLVTGQEGLPLGPDGQPTQVLRKTRRLRAEGYAIEILKEEDFFVRLGLLEQQKVIHRRYTMMQLSRILEVPHARLRSWVRKGLIEPIDTIHRLAYFDYEQVATARMLVQLVDDGLTPSEIRAGLARLRGWVPAMETPLAQLSSLESDGGLVVRLRNGQLADPTGQLRFDFEEEDESPPTVISSPRLAPTADEAFELALQFEDHGDLDAATSAYLEAIDQEPSDPILHFNLGNVEYMLGHLDEALEHFRTAARLDPRYVEAWNNLGSVMCEIGDHDQAIVALQRALSLVPDYADAHYNLADTMNQLGRIEEARPHWLAYLELDPSSAWADEVREKLAASSPASP